MDTSELMTKFLEMEEKAEKQFWEFEEKRMKLEQEQEERRRKDESEREERQRREDRQFLANMMTMQMNLMRASEMRASSNYAIDQQMYPAAQSGYRSSDYYGTSDVLGDVRKTMDQL